MNVTLRVSTGAKVLVWREADVLHAKLDGSATEPQTRLSEDLFEAIAELGGLDLEEGAQAAEAIRLAEEAEQRLGFSSE
jgi:hypothetical protein